MENTLSTIFFNVLTLQNNWNMVKITYFSWNQPKFVKICELKLHKTVIIANFAGIQPKTNEISKFFLYIYMKKQTVILKNCWDTTKKPVFWSQNSQIWTKTSKTVSTLIFSSSKQNLEIYSFNSNLHKNNATKLKTRFKNCVILQIYTKFTRFLLLNILQIINFYLQTIRTILQTHPFIQTTVAYSQKFEICVQQNRTEIAQLIKTTDGKHGKPKQ